MAEVGDVLRVKNVCRVTGLDSDILNVYYFKVTAVSGLPVLNTLGTVIRDWWYDQMLSELYATQSNQLSYVSMTVDNLMAFETEFITVVPSAALTGSVGSPIQGPFVTYSLQLVRELRTTRNGRKGIAGVPSSLVVNNTISPAAVEDLLAFGDQLTNPADIDTGTGVSMSLLSVIAKTPTPPATLPTVFNGVSNVIVRGVGSQVTRKSLG